MFHIPTPYSHPQSIESQVDRRKEELIGDGDDINTIPRERPLFHF